MSLTIHCKYKYFDSTVQWAEDKRQKFHFCRLPFAVNVMLNLSINWAIIPDRTTIEHRSETDRKMNTTIVMDTFDWRPPKNGEKILEGPRVIGNRCNLNECVLNS